jgi:GT2 family glycosyltransferase
MRTHGVINAWLKRDPRFRVIRREMNGGVGAASQDGLLAAKGGFVMVLDHDDLLEPDALYHVAKKILADPSVDVIYSDEILMDENGNVFKIVFRPDFSPDFLLSHPYIVHLVAYNKEVAVAAGGYNIHYDVSQDYELLLKIASRSDKFAHIPRPLYRWRIHPTSTGHQKQDKVMDLSKKAIIEYLRNTGQKDSYVIDGPSFNFFRVRRKIKPASVDIVIPTKDRADLLRKCVDSLTTKTVLTDDVRYKIIIADNGSVQKSTIGYFNDLEKRGATIVDCGGPFNFSSINNKAAAAGNADYILFLNNDIEVIEPEWLLSMLEQAQRPEVGAVGAKLLYPDGTIQHAGVLIGINGVAGHSHQFYPEFTDGHVEGGHLDSLLCIRECMAVTGACMMMRRSVFEEVGGFDENFAVGFGDTDLCLRIYTRGYKTVWTPYARLIHDESASRGKASFETHREDTILMRLKWEEIIKKGDPFYNPNLSLRTNIFSPR